MRSRSAGGSASSSRSLAVRSVTSPVAKLVRWRCSGGYSASSPSAISARPEWRATSGGEPAAAASAATIPNASGKIDGTTVTSASGSRWTRWRCSSGPVKSVRGGRQPLELLAVVAEADDHRAGVELLQRLEQQVDALVVEQLPEVEDGRLVARPRNAARRSALPSSGRRSLPSGSAGRAAPPRAARPAPRARGWGRNSSTSTPGGTSWTRSTWPTTSSSTRRMCSEPTKTAVGARERLPPPRLQLRVAAHRVLELRAVRLDREARAARRADRAAEQDVVGEDEVGGELRAHRGRVQLDVALPLLAASGPGAAAARAPRSGRARTPAGARRARDARAARRRGRTAPGAAPGRRRRRRARRGSTRARARACRRSTRSRRAGTRARGGSSRAL